MENKELENKLHEVLLLEQQRDIYLDLAKRFKAELEGLRETTRQQLLDEFDEGMEQVYLISDDFRAQVKQMKSLFQELLEEMQYQAEIIRMDMIAAKEGSYGEE